MFDDDLMTIPALAEKFKNPRQDVAGAVPTSEKSLVAVPALPVIVVATCWMPIYPSLTITAVPNDDPNPVIAEVGT